MPLRLITFFSCLLAYSFVAAQASFSISKLDESTCIDQFFQYTTTDQNISLLGVDESSLTPKSEDYFNFLRSTQYVYLKTTILNDTKHQFNGTIELRNSFIDSVQFYTVKNSITDSFPIRGFKTKNKQAATYPISIAPGETTTLIIVLNSKDATLRFSIDLWDVKAYDKHIQDQTILWAFLSGVMIVIAIISLLYAISVREVVYVYYAGFVLTNLMYALLNTGLINQYFHAFIYATKGPPLLFFSFISIFFSAQFIANFFKDTPLKIKRITQFLAFSFWILIFLPFKATSKGGWLIFGFTYYYVSIFICFVMFFLILIHGIKRRRQGAYLLLFAHLPLTILYIIVVLRNLNVLHVGSLFTGPIAITYIWEIILSAIAVNIRFSRYKTDKETYQNELLNQQKEFNARLIEAQEEERKKIAQYLHDGVGQQLTGIKLGFQKISDQVKNKEWPQKHTLNNLVKVADLSIQEVRSLSHDLMPKALLALGLYEAISDLLEQSLGQTNIQYSLERFGSSDRIGSKIEITLYRICQELITNIIKHSNAKEVHFQLINNGRHIVLLVEDDGIGMEKKQDIGIGIQNISDRLAALNGEKNIQSTNENSGLLITIKIPLK